MSGFSLLTLVSCSNDSTQKTTSQSLSDKKNQLNNNDKEKPKKDFDWMKLEYKKYPYSHDVQKPVFSFNVVLEPGPNYYTGVIKNTTELNDFISNLKKFINEDKRYEKIRNSNQVLELENQLKSKYNDEYFKTKFLSFSRGYYLNEFEWDKVYDIKTKSDKIDYIHIAQINPLTETYVKYNEIMENIKYSFGEMKFEKDIDGTNLYEFSKIDFDMEKIKSEGHWINYEYDSNTQKFNWVKE